MFFLNNFDEVLPGLNIPPWTQFFVYSECPFLKDPNNNYNHQTCQISNFIRYAKPLTIAVKSVGH